METQVTGFVFEWDNQGEKNTKQLVDVATGEEIALAVVTQQSVDVKSIGSMYDILPGIYHIHQPNVGK